MKGGEGRLLVWEMVMMLKHVISLAVATVLLVPGTVKAQSLLGILGGSDSDALITVGDGNAEDSGLVNVGLGGGDGLVSANIGGGGDPMVGANVLGSGGIADVNIGLGGLDANVSVGGPGGLVGVTIGGGVSGGGNGNNGNNGSNGVLRPGGGGGASPASLGVACAGTSAGQLVSLFQSSTTNGWNRASGIQLVPVRVCADLRRQVANWLAANGAYHQLVGAVARDPLINAALSRTRYQPGHVLGVQRQGATLMVYVF